MQVTHSSRPPFWRPPDLAEQLEWAFCWRGRDAGWRWFVVGGALAVGLLLLRQHVITRGHMIQRLLEAYRLSEDRGK